MATVTWTSSLAGAINPPRKLHVGVMTDVVQVTGAASATVGDVFRLLKLPDRATILGGKLYVNPAAGALDVALRLTKVEHSGTSTALATLLASTTGSASTIYELSSFAAVGYQISLSDSLVTKFVYVDAVVGAVGTTSGSPVLKLMLQYKGNASA